MARRYWLMKTEPDVYSIDDLERDGVSPWEGVRRRSPESAPVWMMVDVRFVERFRSIVPLNRLKTDAALDGMLVTLRGQRLSVQPVDPAHFRQVRKLGRAARDR